MTAPRPRRSPRSRRSVLDTVLGLACLAVMLFPVYWMVNASLQPGVSTADLRVLPVSPSLDGYREAVAGQGGNLVTSLVVSLGAVAVCLCVATPAAYALSLHRVRCSGAVLFILLLSQMIPGIIIANALYSAYNTLGILNTVPGLILADSALGIPFSILIIRAFMSAIPVSILEAARVDGSSRFQEYWAISFPLLLPIFPILFLQISMAGINVFDELLALSGDRYELSTLLVYHYRTSFRFLDLGLGSAISYLILLSSGLLGYFYIRRIGKERSR